MTLSEAYHPDLRNIARVLPQGIFGPRTVSPLRVLTKIPSLRRPKDIQILRLSESARIRLYSPPQPQRANCALLWIHGGGYVIGSAAQDDHICRRFSQRLNVLVASVDYRLAPRNPYPAALNDCYEALDYLVKRSDVDSARVAIGGASAGGGLAAALALLARDRGELHPLFQLLVYPMVDDRSELISPNPRYRLWNPTTDRVGWRAYLGSADPDVAVPARQKNFSDLPPTWIGVGTLDPLQRQDTEYAVKLLEAGVPCDLDVVPGAFHGFDMVAPRAGVSRDFFDRQCDALAKAFNSE